MAKQKRIPIPIRYLAKLAVEMILLSLVIALSSWSYAWLQKNPGFGPIVSVALRFLIFLFGASLMVRLLAMIYRSRKHLPYHKKDNVTIGLSNLFMMVIAIYAFISVFGMFGISLSHMFTSVSIVAAALAIISKDFIADVISGVVISFSKELNIDDYVKIGENKGKIIDINIAKTAMLNEDDDIIFLPNSTVFTSEIINFTKKQIKKTTIDFEVPTGSISSVEDLEEHLIRALTEYHTLIEPNSYLLRVINIKKDFIQLKFQYSLIQFSREMERMIKRKAVRHIVKYLQQHKPK